MMHSFNYVTVKEVLNNRQKLFGGQWREECVHETLNIKFSGTVNFAILRENFEFQ